MRSLIELLIFFAAALMVLVLSAILHLAAASALAQSNPSAGWWESSEEFKDSDLVAHLRDPDAIGRAHAGAMLAKRWGGADYVKLLKDDWQAGTEALNGYWPKRDDAPLANFLLTTTKTKDEEREAVAYILAMNLHGDKIALYSGPIRDIALRLWCERWANDALDTLNIANPGRVWYVASGGRKWLRDFLAVDGEWSGQAGWRLREFRLAVAVYAGDEVAAEKIEKSEFLTALVAGVKTGKNPCDRKLEMPAGKSDWLVSEFDYPGFGTATYAELVCILCDRPDWIAATHERLKAVEVEYPEWSVGPDGKVDAAGKKYIDDCRTDLVSALHAINAGKLEEAFKMFGLGFRGEWLHYGISWQGGAMRRAQYRDAVDLTVLLHHPWARKAASSAEWRKWWGEEWLSPEWDKFDDYSK